MVSKITAMGKLELVNEKVKVSGILTDMEMLFAEVATGKKITLPHIRMKMFRNTC